MSRRPRSSRYSTRQFFPIGRFAILIAGLVLAIAGCSAGGGPASPTSVASIAGDSRSHHRANRQPKREASLPGHLDR